MSKDYYKILGVDKTASADQLKVAFRKLAHTHHPDKGGDAEKFKEINEAYQVLSNPEKRQQYDRFGSESFSGGNGFNWQNFNQGNANFDFGDIGDMFGGFSDMFGFGQGRRSATPNHDGRSLEMALTIDFTEAVFGAQKEISYQRHTVCPDCRGTGGDPKAKLEDCRSCGGRGRVVRLQRTILGSVQVETICPDCQGEGKKYSRLCDQCSGRGIVREQAKLKVKIPAGINNGETIRLKDQGEAGVKGGNFGDLFLHIRVKEHKKFVRDNDNILSQEEIGVKQAILGDKIEVDTVDGPVTLKIPAGTQPNTTFRIKEHGSHRLHSRGRGDHLVNIKIIIPKNISRGAEKVLEGLNI